MVTQQYDGAGMQCGVSRRQCKPDDDVLLGVESSFSYMNDGQAFIYISSSRGVQFLLGIQRLYGVGRQDVLVWCVPGQRVCLAGNADEVL